MKRTFTHGTAYTEERKDVLCRRYDDARRDWWVSAEDYAADHGLDPNMFRSWCRARGIDPKETATNTGNKGRRPEHWRHGGLCTPRAMIGETA